MNYYIVQELNDVYELYKFNPSTGEETLLSTPEEYTIVHDELIALKAWLYIKQSNNISPVSNLVSYESGGIIKNGIRAIFSQWVYPFTTTPLKNYLTFGVAWGGDTVSKPIITPFTNQKEMDILDKHYYLQYNTVSLPKGGGDITISLSDIVDRYGNNPDHSTISILNSSNGLTLIGTNSGANNLNIPLSTYVKYPGRTNMGILGVFKNCEDGIIYKIEATQEDINSGDEENYLTLHISPLIPSSTKTV